MMQNKETNFFVDLKDARNDMKMLERLEMKCSNEMKRCAAQLKQSKEQNAASEEIEDLEKEYIQTQAKFDLIGSIAEDCLKKNDEEQVACRINSVDVVSKKVARYTGQTSSTDVAVISSDPGEQEDEEEDNDGNLNNYKEQGDNAEQDEDNEEESEIGGSDVNTGNDDASQE